MHLVVPGPGSDYDRNGNYDGGGKNLKQICQRKKASLIFRDYKK